MKRDKGVITAFFAIIMGVIITFLCTLIDFTRVISTKNQLSIAGDAAITSALSSYDKMLFENYGLLTFENNDEIDSIVKEIFKENIPSSGLFNIDVDDENILIEPKGEIFADNDIMKTQMVNSMKYQGSENMVRNVFEKVKNFLQLKSIAKEQKKMEDLESDLRIADKLIEEIQKGKSAALRLTVEIAKNEHSGYFPNQDGFGFKKTYELEDLRSFYSKDSLFVGKAINHVSGKIEDTDIYANGYSSETKLLEVYSYTYSKAVLEMYKEYLNKYKPIDNTQNNASDEENTEELNKKIQIIEATISSIDRKNLNKNNIESFKTIIKELKKQIDSGVKAVNKLLKKVGDGDYNKILDDYEKLTKSNNKSMAELAMENLEYYKKFLNVFYLNDISSAMKSIQVATNTILEEINQLNRKLNEAVIKKSIDDMRSFSSQNAENFYNAFNNEVGTDFLESNKSNIETVIRKICNGNDIKLYSDVTIHIRDVANMLRYLRDGVSKSVIDLGPMDDNTKYKDFYKLFKDKKKELQKEQRNKSSSNPTSVYAVLKSLKDKASGVVLNANELPNKLQEKADKQPNPETPPADVAEFYDDDDYSVYQNVYDSDLFMDIDKMGDDFNSLDLESDSILNDMLSLGGEFVDKLYIVEYVMTNFKDMVMTEESIKSDSTKAIRIPAMTDNTTKLNFEIESIIAGKYSDKKSYDTMLDDFIATRLTLNTISLVVYQEGIMKFISKASKVIAATTTLPPPLIKYIMIGAWAAMETRVDIIDLYSGYKVPLLKQTTSTWYTDLGIDWNLDNIDIDETMNTISNEFTSSSKKYGNSYNNQKLEDNEEVFEKIGLDYSDLLRFKLLIMDTDEIIDRTQDLIAANRGIASNYNEFNTKLEVKIIEPNVNILFNSTAFSSNKENYKFKGFRFIKGYN